MTADKTPSKPKLPAILQTHGFLIAAVLMVVVIFLKNVMSLGLIGGDIDDTIRLVQIKDYLAGQSWFNTDQYRMGLAGGTDMHWSRIPDIPIIVLTYIFDLFMPQERALIWAYSVWPPLSAFVLIYGCFIGAKHWAHDNAASKIKIFILCLLGLFVITFHRFAPGSIDHHNLQLGFLGLCVGFVLDPKLRFWPYFISGFALAMSIAIGAEIYVFAAIICGFIALHWAYHGRAASFAAQGFGLGFAITLLAAFFGTVAPSEYRLIHCDALSMITVTVGALGGLGLAIAANLDSRKSDPTNWLKRGCALGALGVICAAVLVFQAPQCLVNPLDSLPQDVTRLWLDNIEEARPITHKSLERSIIIPHMLGAPVVAIIVLCLGLRRQFRKGLSETPYNQASYQMGQHILLLSLIIAALGLTAYQIRFYPFAFVFAIIPLAGWISKVYTDTKRENPDSVAYLAALIISAPFAWEIPGKAFKALLANDTENTLLEPQAQCVSADVIKSFKALPVGTVLAGPDMSGHILMQTSHRVVSGNYHRNFEGIATQIQIAVSDPDKAGHLIWDNDIDYVYFCNSATSTAIYKAENSKGLTANLSQGLIPDYLDAVSDPGLEGGGVIIFKVKRPQT